MTNLQSYTKEQIKKLDERAMLDGFLGSMRDRPVGSIHAHEPPDFLVDANSGTIGIELVRLMASESLKNRRALRKKVCSLAQTRFECSGGADHHVLVDFADGIRLRDNRIHAVSQRIEHLVRELNLSPGDTREFEDAAEVLDAPEVTHLRVARPSFAVRCVWQPVSVGMGEAVSEEHVAVALAKKEPKLGLYREAVKEVWLLMTISHDDASGRYLLLPEAGHTLCPKTGFDRLFIFSAPGSSVLELPRAASETP